MFRDIALEKEYGETLAEYFNIAITYAKDVYGTEVYACVTDNDSKICCGARKASTLNGKKLLDVTCTSHSLNLLMKSLTNPEFVKEMRDVIKTFRDSALQSAITLYGGTKIRTLSDTRFGYIRDTCECLLKNLAFIRTLCDDEDLVSKVSPEVLEKVFDVEFENKMKETLEFLTPACKLMNKAQDPRYTIAEATQYWLELKFPTEGYSEEEKANVNIILNQRINKAVKGPMLAANLLHPKYQGALLSNVQKQEAENFLDITLDSQEKQELENFMQNRDTKYKTLFEKCDNSAIDFWAFMNFTLPNLSKFAISLLSIPASTAQLEAVFSHWKFVHNDRKGNMHDETSGYLIDIYHSLKFINFEDGNLLDMVKRYPRRHLEL